MRVLLSFLLVWFLSGSPFAFALSSGPSQDEAIAVKLISQIDSLGDQKNIWLGLDVTLGEGWHTYWRSVGLVGLPPSLDWTGSENLDNAQLFFPAPQREVLMGMETVGYKNHVLFPLRIKLKNIEDTNLNLSLEVLVCKELCIPRHFTLGLALPVGDGARGAEAVLLDQAIESLPSHENSDALSIMDTQRKADEVSVTVQSNRPLDGAALFLEANDQIPFTVPTLALSEDKLTGTFTAQLVGDLPQNVTFAQFPIWATVTHGADSLEHLLPVQPDEPVKVVSSDVMSSVGLMTILALALLGGFILNLMPCVLPVLSLKIFSVMKHGGNAHHKIRHSFLSTASGVLFSFILLAVVTIALKAGGQAIGWGIQFQQPIFLVFMITLLTLFTANLWGFFEITMPRFIMDSFAPNHHPMLASDFATGVLATLLATPCTAPFLGTAIGFALSAGWIQILLVFTMLGFGMALPYFIIALWPKLASVFPKPGAWMEKLTRLLGLGLAATAVWLLLVLHQQIGAHLAIVVALGMMAILVQLYLRHKNKLRRLTLPIIFSVFIGAFSIGLAATVPDFVSRDSSVWQKFDEAELARYVSEGKTVFVDISADWCITCKANKRFTLSREEVARRIFNNKDVIAMEGDWTSPDPVITAYLQRQGRYGIPFNAVYGPRAPDGILLPELLTVSEVIDALGKANSPSTACPAEGEAGQAC